MLWRRGAATLLGAAFALAAFVLMVAACTVTVPGVPSAGATAPPPAAAPPTVTPPPTATALPTRPEFEPLTRTLDILVSTPCRALYEDQIITLGYSIPGTQIYDDQSSQYRCEWLGVNRSIVFNAGYLEDRLAPLLQQTDLPVRPVTAGGFDAVEVLLPASCAVVALTPLGSTTVVAGGEGVRMISSTPAGQAHCDAALRATEAILENAA